MSIDVSFLDSEKCKALTIYTKLLEYASAVMVQRSMVITRTVQSA